MKPVWKQTKENLIIRAKVISAIRDFFEEEGFLEVETPTLVVSPDPSPFNEVLETKTLSGERLFLTPSPEFFLKKLLVAGFTDIFEITRAYRDRQEKDNLHLTEFTILEWYRSGADYLSLMADCENLVGFVCQQIKEKSKINFSPPWPRISCAEAFKKYAKVDLDKFLDINTARKICKQKNYNISPETTWEEMYHQIFLNEVEPYLIKMPAVILFDYPAPLAALSKIKEDNPCYAERFEFYLGGLEMGNGYSELTDWQEQEKRLKADIKARKKKKMKVFDYDQGFVEALKEGLPKTAGIAVGLNRLVMFFTGSTDIHQVAPFSVL